MIRRRLTVLVLALVVVAATGVLAGCGVDRPVPNDVGISAVATSGASPTASQVSSPAPSGSATPRSTPHAAHAAAASAAAAKRAPVARTSTVTATVPVKRLSAGEAAVIDAELSAIQGELDRTAVPSDKDFNSIGAGLK